MAKKPPIIIEHYDAEIDFLKPGEGSLFVETKTGLVVDVETTGLSFQDDEIIEIALVQFKFEESSGNVVEIVAKEDFLQEPKSPLSKEIIELTGLTDEMLKGQKIPSDRVNEIFASSDVVIAHNAFFDRNFIHAKFKGSQKLLWACSKDDIPWRSFGFACRVLQHLCRDMGFYYEGHRAEIDCLALLKLLTMAKANHKTFLSQLIENAQVKEFQVNAVGAPFESKDLLKNAGFRWNAEEKFWYKKVVANDLKELEKLMPSVYTKGKTRHQVLELSQTGRFLLES